MIPNQNILTEITASFKATAENAVSIITPTATHMLLGLTGIAILLTSLYYLASETSSTDIMFYFKKNFPSLFKYASFTFIITQYNVIINAIVESFFKIGGLAGGTAIPESMFSNPSVISETGLKLMIPIWENYVSNNIGKIMFDITALIASSATGGITSAILKGGQAALGIARPNSILIMILMIIITLLVIGCFFLMAVNVFVIQIELAIIASLFLILIPFGAWDKTEFMFHNAKNTIINMGIKYMVLSTIMSISMAIINNIEMPVSPSYQEMFMLLLMVVGLTAMTIFLPTKIAAEMQG